MEITLRINIDSVLIAGTLIATDMSIALADAIERLYEEDRLPSVISAGNNIDERRLEWAEYPYEIIREKLAEFLLLNDSISEELDDLVHKVRAYVDLVKICIPKLEDAPIEYNVNLATIVGE